MTGFGRMLFGGSPWLFWALAPVLVFGVVSLSWPPPEDPFALAAVGVSDVAAVLLVLSLWPYGRIPGVRRLFTAWVAAAFGYYVLLAWFPDDLPGRAAPASRWPALAGFVLVGLPCWKYAFLGRFTLRPEPIAVPPDEPLLLEAYRTARLELARRAAEWTSPPPGLAVSFAFETEAGDMEHLWGEVTEHVEEGLIVRVVTQPVGSGPLETWTVAFRDVEDFAFEDEQGRLHGEYTTAALAAYADRESLPVPNEIRRRLQRRAEAA